MDNEYKGIAAPHIYDDGVIYNDQGIQPHIAYMASFFDKESRDATGTLYAASPLLLSALINILDFPQEDLQAWRTDNSPIPITITPSQLDSALSAIEAALNLKNK